MNGNGIDIMDIVLMVLAALTIGGGTYAVIVKKKLGEAVLLFASLTDLVQTYLRATGDGAVTPEEREELMAKINAVVSAFTALVSQGQWTAAITAARRKKIR